jgi:hypothetical protein
VHIGEQLAELGSALHFVGEPLGGDPFELVTRLVAPRPQDREAAVPRDCVDPGLEADRLFARDDVGVG